MKDEIRTYHDMLTILGPEGTAKFFEKTYPDADAEGIRKKICESVTTLPPEILQRLAAYNHTAQSHEHHDGQYDCDEALQHPMYPRSNRSHAVQQFQKIPK